MRPGAVFDLDGTLLPGTSAERLLVPYLVRRGFVGARQLARFVGRALSFPLRGRAEALRRNKRYLVGLAVEGVDALVEDFVAEVLAPRLSPAVVGRLGALRGSGHAVCLLTGAPGPIARALGRRLGAVGALGTELEVREGRYTGRIRGTHPFGEGKLVGLDELVRVHGLDLRRSFAFADHASDAALLSRFGHPVAVNPDRALRRVADARGWPTMRGRRATRRSGAGRGYLVSRARPASPGSP